MLKYTFFSPLIQNILEIFSLPSPKKNFNYIPLPSYVKIYTLLPQYFLISNNLTKNNNLTHLKKIVLRVYVNIIKIEYIFQRVITTYIEMCIMVKKI